MEERLSDPQVTIRTIQKYDFDFQKRYGQNFLVDDHVLTKAIRAAELSEEDAVLEIGPGFGTMTQALAKEAGKVLAVEIDAKLIPILQDTLKDYPNVEVIHGDVMKLDLATILKEKCEGRPVKVVANLPYYITTPILMELLEKELPIESITVMVQKEVAQRMQTGPGTKDYGALSLAVQYYAEPYLVANVPPNCFIPRPNVASAVIRLTVHKEKPVTCEDPKLMFRLIRASFNQRRKTLENGIGNDASLNIDKETVKKALGEMGLEESLRGETLSLAQFAALSDAISRIEKQG